MKHFFILLFLTVLSLACQQTQTPQGSALPDAKSNIKSHIRYRILTLQLNRKYEEDSELYIRDFEAKVNQAITEGWQPIGGVATAGMGLFPIQAMMKAE